MQKVIQTTTPICSLGVHFNAEVPSAAPNGVLGENVCVNAPGIQSRWRKLILPPSNSMLIDDAIEWIVPQ